MARVTVEDCIERVPNRFDLVMIAAQRAREIAAGALLTVERDNDKNPVIALREIAEETVDSEFLEKSLIHGLQKRADFDDFEDEDEDALDAAESEMKTSLNPTPGLSLGDGPSRSQEGEQAEDSAAALLQEVAAPEKDSAAAPLQEVAAPEKDSAEAPLQEVAAPEQDDAPEKDI